MNPETNTTGLAMDNMPQREKSWPDLTDTEKIERLRTIIKGYQWQIDSVAKNNRKMQKHFYGHKHDLSGEMVGKLDQYDYDGFEVSTGSMGLSSSDGWIYF